MRTRMRTRSSRTFIAVAIAVTAAAGCASPPADVGSDNLIVTTRCRVVGAGTVAGDSFEGDVHGDVTAPAGSWTHRTSGGDVLVAVPDFLECRINGAIIADFDGRATWNGAPDYYFTVQIHDRGVPTPTRSPGTPTTVSVSATRLYSPSRWLDGTLAWPDGALVTVPASLPVTVGNAGNQWARVTFTLWGSGEPVRCSYRGGARTANPRDPADVAAGLSYRFVRCERLDPDGCGWERDPSIVAGTEHDVEALEVHVQHGSSRHPSRSRAQTTVTVDFAATPFVVTTPESDWYSLRVFAPDAVTLVHEAEGELTSGDIDVVRLF